MLQLMLQLLLLLFDAVWIPIPSHGFHPPPPPSPTAIHHHPPTTTTKHHHPPPPTTILRGRHGKWSQPTVEGGSRPLPSAPALKAFCILVSLIQPQCFTSCSSSPLRQLQPALKSLWQGYVQVQPALKSLWQGYVQALHNSRTALSTVQANRRCAISPRARAFPRWASPPSAITTTPPHHGGGVAVAG